MADGARLYRTGHRCPHCKQVHMYSDLTKDQLIGRLALVTDWYQPDGSPVITDSGKRTICQSCGAPWAASFQQLEEQS